MRYLSVCSGIEAATVAWHHLGWTPVAFSEIELFPSAVLKHHYPTVPNLGDMTNFKEWDIGTIDLLVGGTPCQSFSVAGLRKGLRDPRGGLMLTFLEIAQRYRPRWIVWENVPGVLSSNGGRDFGAFLGALGELGYGWAYRVLDAQWFGVAQRRRRVFVVACLGDQASAAAVLFESESVSRNPPPRREARQGFARGVEGSTTGGGWPAELASTLNAAFGEKQGLEDQHALSGASLFVPSEAPLFATSGQTNAAFSADIALALNATNEAPYVAKPTFGSHWDSPLNPHPTLNQSAKGSGGIAASDQELFSQRGSGLVPQAIAWDEELNASVEQAGTLLRGGAGGRHDGVMVPQAIAIHPHVVGRSPNAGPQGKEYIDDGSAYCMDARGVPQSVVQPIAFKVRGGVEVDSGGKAAGKGYLGSEETAFTLAATQDQWLAAPPAMQVRRLTTIECERLQGFPDNYTNIPWRGKPESPDGPRYKALGNSMAVPCMKWIGERINAALRQVEGGE